MAREKTSLATDLDDWKNRIQRQEIDLSQVRLSIEELGHHGTVLRVDHDLNHTVNEVISS